MAKRSTLDKKIVKTLDIIKETGELFSSKDLAVTWKGGKDSTVLLHIIKNHFGHIPFPVFFNDTTFEFPETYQFITMLRKRWCIDLITIKTPPQALRDYHILPPDRQKHLLFGLKIKAIDEAIRKYNLQAFMVGIRWDENPSRSEEKYFSRRKNHLRIHPILHFTEKDIWNYIHKYHVPYVSLYDHGYRSLGMKHLTKPAATSERDGRDQDKEKIMSRLRSLGYW